MMYVRYLKAERFLAVWLAYLMSFKPIKHDIYELHSTTVQLKSSNTGSAIQLNFSWQHPMTNSQK